ncbi:hypothetical protein ACFQ0U_06350 [Photorhabdus akhurstii subsp. bharatensis]
MDTASSDLVEHSKQPSKGLLSKSSVETHDEVHERRAQSTTLSGDRVTVQKGYPPQSTAITPKESCQVNTEIIWLKIRGISL